MRDHRQGSTLLEVLLAMGILVLLAGFGFKAVAVGDRSAARVAAGALAAGLRQVQEQAVATGVDCWMRLTAPADQQAEPARYALRCDDAAGVLAFRPDTDLDPGVRVSRRYLVWVASATPGDGGWTICTAPAAPVNLDNECYGYADVPDAGLRIGFSPSGLRTATAPADGRQLVLMLQDRAGRGAWWVRVRAVTGEVRVCRPDSEQMGGRTRIQCR